MNKHTPGPWAIARTRQLGGPFDDNGLNSTHFWNSQVIVGGPNGGNHIADVNLFHVANDYTESNANARLIAASPSLLEACIDIRDFLRANGYDTRIVDSAIAKATE